MSDSWEPTRTSDAPSEASVGGEPGEGLFANQAFSVEMVLRNGTALLREQPAFLFGGAFLILLAQIAPSLVALPINVLVAMQAGTGAIDQSVADGITSVIRLVLALVFLPIQMLLFAGFASGAGRYVAGEPLKPMLLLTSMRGAVRALLYRILTGFVMLAITALLLGPVALLGYASAEGMVPDAAFWVAFVALGLAYAVAIVYVALGLQLGIFSAVLDDVGPIEAMTRSWHAASGARLTIFVTDVVFGVPLGIALLLLYCLIGLALYPAIYAVYQGGLAASWLLLARPEPRTREWPFYQRNPTPFV
jgi:hypothetical protein